MTHLERLKKSKNNTVVFHANNPRKLAHYLRQAQRFLSASPDKSQHINFKFAETQDSVICTRKIQDFETLEETVIEYGRPKPGITTLEEVIGVLVSEELTTPIFFPDFAPTTKQVELLEKWGVLQKIEFSLRDNKLLATRSDE